MNERMQIVFAVNLIAIFAVAVAWLTGHLSWSVGSQIVALWLLCPFGIVWSWPEGKRLSIWRTIVSLIVIAGVSTIIGSLL